MRPSWRAFGRGSASRWRPEAVRCRFWSDEHAIAAKDSVPRAEARKTMTSSGAAGTSNVNLAGRRGIVTGASSGLGRECARVLAQRGAQVGLVCRSPRRGALTLEAFANEIGQEATGRCEVLECDLAKMASVSALVQSVAARGPVDLLFLNAGVSNQPFMVTAEGFEATFASNYLGHFLLVHRLVALSALTPTSRIVTTLSSAVETNLWAKADLKMLATPATHAGRFSPLRAGPSTKVMLALMGGELVRRVAGTPRSGVSWVGVVPGAVRTGNVEQMAPWQRRLVLPLIGWSLRPVADGVTPLLWAATAPEVAQASGAVFGRDGRRVPLRRVASDPAAAKRLWELSERLLNLSPWAFH
jgi:NAD(P)-dependent dehydrogenase (short-subunit alcohol dehydrogenase family)